MGTAEHRRPEGLPAAAGPPTASSARPGLGQFAQLDDQRGGAWPTTQLNSGANYTFKWHLTAAARDDGLQVLHHQAGLEPERAADPVGAGADAVPDRPLNGAPAADHLAHRPLPGRTGRHMILAVWTIADTANAFYQCSDVRF